MESVRSFGTNLNPFKSTTTPTSSYSDFSMNNIVIIVTFGIMVYVLVQMLIVLNRPEFLYYTLSPIPTDLENETFGKVKYSEELPLAKLNEFTYSFWVYLREVKNVSDATEDDPKPQLLFMRNNKDNFENANPVVYIKNNTNTMKIALRTGDATGNDSLDDIHNNSTNAYEHFTIEYIPVKRWVNVMINVDNKRVTIFLDGEIVSTRILDNSVSETNSDVYVGKSDENTITTPNALISKIQFFNYSIRTPNDIRKIYDDGPIKKQTVMRMLLNYIYLC